jgi:glycosyltransferase involved in cell wall biosynthesis
MRSIQSVLVQTLPVTEIIVVDDGSTDGTAELIHAHYGSTIRLLRHPTNLGAAAARNTGMSAVSADCAFIAWLDSDDEWLPEKIEMQISLFSHIPSLAAVCTAYTLIQGKSQFDYIPLDRKPWSEGLLFGCDLGPGTTLLVRRAAALATGLLDTSLTRYEDWDWLLRLARKHEMTLLPQVLARVYRNDRQRTEFIESSVEIFIKKYQMEFIALGRQRARKALARFWLDIAWAYYMDGCYLRRERHYFWKAIRLNPVQPAGVYIGLLDSVLGSHWSTALHFFKKNTLKKFHH